MTPRGGTDRVEGVGPSGELLVRVRAAPAGGAANAALLRTLADAFDIAPSRITLERGAAGRHKVVAIEGLSAVDALARWPELRTSS